MADSFHISAENINGATVPVPPVFRRHCTHAGTDTGSSDTFCLSFSATQSESDKRRQNEKRERERASLLAQQKSEWGDGHRKPCDHIFLLAPFNVTLS
jgi:hypothetical protein